ncbi:MAG: sn-glycerol-3-phosphate ABC transporter ATP-binding protein UgpC [Rhizobiales bacterium]|nr:sn-glycerol-3-phosphate ABC transporter ATP-binding protein UgpC [Hyphomicrobiales bacterium]
MARIELKNISKSYGNIEVMRDINLDFADGEFIVLVGPSGCGKSTLLRMIAGLETISGGDLFIEEVRVNDVEPRDRDVAMVFQSYALYPHMDVARNMGFSLEIRGEKAEIIKGRTAKSAKTLGLGALLERLPKALSGGQRQRVAMGRAIARDPKVFLFDEPLSNLDASLRAEMRLEIAKLHKRLAASMIYVTHDQVEALTLADRIVVLNEGEIQQVGKPLELYEQPRNLFVANFIGSPQMNIMKAEFTDNRLVLENGERLEVDVSLALNEVAHFGIRPEHISIVGVNEGHAIGEADVVERLGSDSNIYVNVENIGQILVRYHGDISLEVGDKFGLKFNLDRSHLFDLNGMAIR